MLEIFAAIGGGLFVLASLVVGGRLVWIARQTRGLPELALGSALFLMGGVGYPLMSAAILATSLSNETRTSMLLAQMITTLLGMGGIVWFTRKVFRPGTAWATVLWLAVTGAYVGLAGAQVLGPGLLAFLHEPEKGPWAMGMYAGIVAMSWAGIESIRYWRMQLKRLALGLADPVVADRFRLWGTAILTADAISIISAGFQWAGVKMTGTASGAIVVGFLGLYAASMLWLAFVPSANYLERVRRRAVSA
jgi:hypothetical protein